jgi:hypothetical protein
VNDTSRHIIAILGFKLCRPQAETVFKLEQLLHHIFIVGHFISESKTLGIKSHRVKGLPYLETSNYHPSGCLTSAEVLHCLLTYHAWSLEEFVSYRYRPTDVTVFTFLGPQPLYKSLHSQATFVLNHSFGNPTLGFMGFPQVSVESVRFPAAEPFHEL